MAHFYGTTQGNRGMTSRIGQKSSGIISTASGWDIGGIVEVSYSEHIKTDVVKLYHTNGSNGKTRKLVAAFAKIDSNLVNLDTDYPELFI